MLSSTGISQEPGDDQKNQQETQQEKDRETQEGNQHVDAQQNREIIVQTSKSDRRWNNVNLSIIFIVLLVAGFCLSFHIVTTDGTDVILIPKEHLTFANTFVNLHDVIDEYNNAGIMRKVELESTYLCQELLKRGHIVSKPDI